MIKRWGKPWYYIGIAGNIAFIILFIITVHYIHGAIDLTCELSQAAYIIIAAIILIKERTIKVSQREQIMQSVFDPIETLTFVAANTEKIALGTSVIDMLFYNPVVLARRFATLDVLSKGRAIAGLGIGWSKDEYQVSGIPFKDRGKRADEFIQALKKIWTDDIVEFKGEYYNIPASKIGPKPIQKPHIPIYLGGFAPNTFSRIAKYADGWLGVAAGPLEYLENGIKTLRSGSQSQ